MTRMRILILAVSAVAAIGLAIILRGVMGGGDPEPVQTVAAPPPRPMARVLVAARELTPGTRLTQADLRWQEWPAEGLNAAFITDGAVAVPARAAPAVAGPNAPPATLTPAAATSTAAPAEGAASPDVQRAQARANAARQFVATLTGHPGGAVGALEGMIVRETVLAGEPVTEAKLVRGGDSGMLAVVLQPGMRAVSVPLSVENGAGGFILPGDHVDVLLSRQEQGAAGGQGFRVATVLRNIRVLAIDQTVEPEPNAQTVVGATATLEVGPREAELLTLARAAGTISLSLRSYADLDGPSGVGALNGTQLGGGSPERRPIRVWRGGTPTEVAQR